MLAVPGNRIRFTSRSFEINGVAHERFPRMPVEDELMVPEKCWFLWPDIAISGRGNVGEAIIGGAMLQMAVVAEKQVKLVGKPFNRWFWRRQIFS